MHWPCFVHVYGAVCAVGIVLSEFEDVPLVEL